MSGISFLLSVAATLSVLPACHLIPATVDGAKSLTLTTRFGAADMLFPTITVNNSIMKSHRALGERHPVLFPPDHVTKAC